MWKLLQNSWSFNKGVIDFDEVYNLGQPIPDQVCIHASIASTNVNNCIDRHDSTIGRQCNMPVDETSKPEVTMGADTVK